MAISLNKHAAACEQSALENGFIKPTSSPMVPIYAMSADWRKLCDATHIRPDGGRWSEREIAVRDIIIKGLIVLRRIGCSDIERLLVEGIAEYTRKA